MPSTTTRRVCLLLRECMSGYDADAGRDMTRRLHCGTQDVFSKEINLFTFLDEDFDSVQLFAVLQQVHLVMVRPAL